MRIQGNDTLSAGDGNDTVSGEEGADTLMGEGGDDNLIYDPLDESIDGGAGTDVLAVADNARNVVIDFTASGRPAAGANRPSISNIEVIDLTGIGPNSMVIDSAALTALMAVLALESTSPK